MSNITIEYVVKTKVILSPCGNCKDELLEQNFNGEAALKFVRCTKCGLSTARLLSVAAAEKQWNAICQVAAGKVITNGKKDRKHITNEIAEKMATLYVNNKPIRDIAIEFGVCENTVRRALAKGHKA